MSLPVSQSSIVDSLLITRPNVLSFDGPKRANLALLIETILVTTVAILVVKIINSSSIAKAAWFLVPAILVAGALLPKAIRNENMAIGLEKNRILSSVRAVFLSCILLFPATLLFLWLLKQCGCQFYLSPVAPAGDHWLTWLFYQFMYVAIAEELFFRGYIQVRILTLMRMLPAIQAPMRRWITICVSAAVFALAHVIVKGSMLSVLTFLPGLVLAWLFIRTKSLLAPILFHGFANAFYFAIAPILT